MKKTGFIGEFREFIARGNVMDLAVGVIIGGAFKGITDSLVNDILNPFLGLFTGGGEALAGLSVNIFGAEIMVGNFINAVINFLIMSFVVFWIVKGFNSLRRKKEEAAQETAQTPPEPELTTQEQLLTEIRDLMKDRRDV